MKYELKPTKLASGVTVYGVVTPTRNVLGWIQSLPSGWRLFGYEDDHNAPLLRTPDEAVLDLIEHDAWEQDTQTWPEMA
jgi:hypothetical protein